MNNPLSSQVGALNGGGDYKLGAFQQVLEQVFPGIIRPYRIPTTGVNTEPNDAFFDGPPMYPNPAGGANISGFERDWEYENQRGMVYTTLDSNDGTKS